MAYKKSRINSLSSRRIKKLKGDGIFQELFIQYGVVLLLYLGLFFSTLVSWIGMPMSGVSPFWTAIIIFTWSVRWPETLPSTLIFFIGLLTDIFTGAPIGVHAFSLLTLAFLARLQQRFLNSQHFIAVWIDFVVLAFLFIFLIGGLSLVVFEQYNAILALLTGSLWSWLLLVIIFPPLSFITSLLISIAKDKNESF